MFTTQTHLSELDEVQVKAWLRGRLSDKRYAHSLGAQQKATEMATLYKFPQPVIQKANWAALLHDAAKMMSPDALLEACRDYGIALSEEDSASPQTLHPFVGAEQVRETFSIDDEQLLNAIRYHTTGRVGMSDVEKLVYIADKIECNTRNPLYTQKITDVIDYSDRSTLDEAMLYIMDSTLVFLIDKSQAIHSRTLAARNDILARRKQQRLKQHPFISTGFEE